jgi:hypothetical protein
MCKDKTGHLRTRFFLVPLADVVGSSCLGGDCQSRANRRVCLCVSLYTVNRTECHVQTWRWHSEGGYYFRKTQQLLFFIIFLFVVCLCRTLFKTRILNFEEKIIKTLVLNKYHSYVYRFILIWYVVFLKAGRVVSYLPTKYVYSLK